MDDLMKDWVKLSPVRIKRRLKLKGRLGFKLNNKLRSAAISKLPEAQNSNIVGLYNRLASGPVPDVSDSTRSQIQAKLKSEIVAQMRAKFPEIKTR